ncbi:MAG TPA: GAF and ANTAR domain-containing protein [Pseudonocardia sp.]
MSTREQLVGRAFVSLADTLVDDYDVIELLTRLVDHSVALLSADAAGILLGDSRGQLRVVASTSEDARLTELMQLQADQGPCLDCYRTVAPVTVTDVFSAADRWPSFVAAATAAGKPAFRASHAVPMRLRGEAIGALNLLGHRPGTMDVDDLALGQALADVATIAILQERAIRRAEVLSEQLQTALTSRVIIEQAKGVLAQHSGLSMEEAFNQMRSWTRGHNRRLSQVARALADRTLDPAVVLPPKPSPRAGPTGRTTS